MTPIHPYEDVSAFSKKSHNTRLICSIFCFRYNFWHGNELFRLLVADSPHKLQEEVQQGNSWLYFALCQAVSVCLSLVTVSPCDSMYQVVMYSTCTFWSLMKVLSPIKLPASQIWHKSNTNMLRKMLYHLFFYFSVFCFIVTCIQSARSFCLLYFHQGITNQLNEPATWLGDVRNPENTGSIIPPHHTGES